MSNMMYQNRMSQSQMMEWIMCLGFCADDMKLYLDTHRDDMEALEYYGAKHPQIVYAQAILETGHFKSNVCLNYNNLFGLYDSKNKDYYKFNHWAESIVAYKEWIQKKYQPPDNYYAFLEEINYANDAKYISILKSIVNNRE